MKREPGEKTETIVSQFDAGAFRVEVRVDSRKLDPESPVETSVLIKTSDGGEEQIVTFTLRELMRVFRTVQKVLPPRRPAYLDAFEEDDDEG